MKSNNLQVVRPQHVKDKISESMKERYKHGKSDEFKRKVSEKQKLNWMLRKQEFQNQNKDINTNVTDEKKQ